MKRKKRESHSPSLRSSDRRRRLVATTLPGALVLLMGTTGAQAIEIDTGNPDLKVRWDNTIKYSAAARLRAPSAALTGALNEDDGDRNFDKGLISNRADLFSEFDIVYRGFGARVSGAAWYDTVYNGSNDHDAPGRANHFSAPFDHFTDATEDLHGRKAELLDAFVFGKTNLGDTRLTFRAGRHALLWGESLFFGANGIAGGQAPIDVVKALSVPNTQFKELIRPTGQISGQLQINPALSIGAYYQFEWEKTRLPAVGSYFSNQDLLDEGGERMIVGAPIIPGGGPAAFFRGDDIEAKDQGQGGVQVKFRVEEYDFGLYAIRYHDKAPQLYLRPGPANIFTGQIGQYVWAYPENIKAYGASATTTLGEFNVAAEVSMRHDTPLSSDGQVDPFGTADNDGNPLYAVGKSAHAQISWLASLGPSFVSREASFLGEIAWNRRLSVSKNRGALNPVATKDATNIRVLYEPMYRQVLPGLDLSVPVGLGYGLDGNSSVVGSFNGERVGDVSIGVSGTYLDVWRVGLNYTHFFGPEGTFLDAANHISFDQSLKDRDFVSFSVRRTF